MYTPNYGDKQREKQKRRKREEQKSQTPPKDGKDGEPAADKKQPGKSVA